jgi:hypothetical protein
VGIDTKGVRQMNRRDVLLKEYEVCQQHINTIGTESWQASAIFLLVNAGVLAYLFQIEHGEPHTLFMVLIIGIIFILIFCFWKRFIKRMQFVQTITFERMREIEDELGLWKNWYVHILDELKSRNMEESDLNSLPKEKAHRIKQLRKSYEHARPAGFPGLQSTAKLLMIGWGVLIINEFISYYFPEFYKNLLDMICVWY